MPGRFSVNSTSGSHIKEAKVLYRNCGKETQEDPCKRLKLVNSDPCSAVSVRKTLQNPLERKRAVPPDGSKSAENGMIESSSSGASSEEESFLGLLSFPGKYDAGSFIARGRSTARGSSSLRLRNSRLSQSAGNGSKKAFSAENCSGVHRGENATEHRSEIRGHGWKSLDPVREENWKNWIRDDAGSFVAGNSCSEQVEGQEGQPSCAVPPTSSIMVGRAKAPIRSARKQAASEHIVPSASTGSGYIEEIYFKERSIGNGSSKLPLTRHSPKTFRTDSLPSASQSDVQAGSSGSAEARKRWRLLSNTVLFSKHLSIIKSSASDFLEHTGPSTMPVENIRSDAGRAGAAAFEGARTRAQGTRARAKGRKGMEGMLVRQDKGLVTLVQDFYVACLKMPIVHFLVGVFLAPIVLGLLFTPLYIYDKSGLALDGMTLSDDDVNVSKIAVTKRKVSAVVNVFLYALSLSTTFGGSPVNAISPFCLVVANINTLMGQFLFVFLSGAVFARMSQPSHPVRCSKKAIMRVDDFPTLPQEELKEKFRVFAVRLVLTGPPPCELVDAKICLTFRIFIKLPSGSMFCSTQDLELVRPEVPYLRYGIVVRHIIDKRSPLYGHSMESLSDGDASFSLTISGQERTSMQPIFHLEDYFVCDGDVAWDSEYVDFIHVNAEGQRVLDHSKIDHIHISPETKFGTGGSPSMPLPEKCSEGGIFSSGRMGGRSANTLRGRKIWSSKSTSFTRADWGG